MGISAIILISAAEQLDKSKQSNVFKAQKWLRRAGMQFHSTEALKALVRLHTQHPAALEGVHLPTVCCEIVLGNDGHLNAHRVWKQLFLSLSRLGEHAQLEHLHRFFCTWMGLSEKQLVGVDWSFYLQLIVRFVPIEIVRTDLGAWEVQSLALQARRMGCYTWMMGLLKKHLRYCHEKQVCAKCGGAAAYGHPQGYALLEEDMRTVYHASCMDGERCVVLADCRRPTWGEKWAGRYEQESYVPGWVGDWLDGLPNEFAGGYQDIWLAD